MSGGLGENLATAYGNVDADVGDPLDLYGTRKDEERARARAAEERARGIARQRDAIENLRQSRIERAALAALGETQGIGSSSLSEGAKGSVVSQSNANLMFAQQKASLDQLISSRLQRAASLASLSRSFGTLSTIAAGFIQPEAPQQSGGVSPVSTQFGATNTTPLTIDSFRQSTTGI
jgi:hypothetical protein